jgi:sortase B
MEILFIGNSFTYYNDMPAVFESLACMSEIDVSVKSVAFGGHYLRQHIQPGSEARKMLETKKWDYVVIQEQSMNPVTDYADFQSSTATLASLARECGAAVVLYQTWAYEKGSAKIKNTGLSYNKMHSDLNKAYMHAAHSCAALRAPVGNAFYYTLKKHPDIGLYDSRDGYHPSALGSYLAACVIFFSIFGSKRKIKFTADLEPATAALLQKSAVYAVKNPHGTKRAAYRIVMLLLLAVFLLSLYKIADYYIQANKSAAEFDRLYDMISSVSPGSPYAEKYKALKEKNPDFVGWISVDGTNISYPVMQSKDRPDFYLRRNFDGQYSYYGTPYVEEECDAGVSDNTIIYGHNMKNGTMFSALDDFASEVFFQTHKYIDFDTPDEPGKYEIFAVFKISADSNDFAYHEFTDAADSEEFEKFVSECRARALYDTGVTAEFGDKLLTLSTCEYTYQNGRLVIVAKRVS